MKKILFLTVILTLLLTACGGVDELEAQVAELQAEADGKQAEVEDLQSELTLAESEVESLMAGLADTQSELDLAEATVGLCVVSLEEATTFSSVAEDALGACLVEVEALSIGPEAGGGGEGEVVADVDECAGTERTLMMSTPVLQQAVDKDGDPKYNDNGLMIMVAIPNSRVEDFAVGDVICVTEHYAVSGGWAVFLISGTRTADYNLFIPAHYLEPLPEENVPFEPLNCDPSYPTVCIPPPPPNLSCGEIIYENFVVVGSDPHGFDGDNDGIGCE